MQIKKGLSFESSETLVIPAPLTKEFSNQLFEDFKKLYELKPFITVEAESLLSTDCSKSLY